jgi:hypothetical protein
MWRAAIGALLVGCWSAPPPPPPIISSQSPRATVVRNTALPEPREAIPLHSEWSGRYTCGQGVTGVVLAIDTYSTGEAVATFEFAALPENPNVPSGAYKLRGEVRLLPGGNLEAHFEPDQWLDQPPGYVMVPFTVVSDAKHRALRGKIETAGCGAIEVKRAR